MSESQLEVSKGQHFSKADVGALTDLGDFRFLHPHGKGRAYPGKLFLKTPLDMSGMEVSMNKLPAGQSVPFYHQHREHEELYIFLKGRGQFMVDNTVLEVSEGTVIRVAPDGVRTWRNNAQEDLYYIVIQAKAGTMQAHDIEDGVGCPQPVSWPD